MSRKDRYATVARIATGVLLLLYILHRIDEQQLLTLLGHSLRDRWPLWIIASLATYVGLHCGVFRWHGLLRANGIRTTFASVYRHFFIGQFFNAFMLGACGGDMARAIAVTRSCPDRRAAAIATVVIDRGIGLFVTVAVGCTAILLRKPLFSASRTNRAAALLTFLFFAGTIVATLMLFGRHLFERWPVFQRIERSGRLGPALRKAYESFYFYRSHPAALWQASVLSIINLLALTMACYFVGLALDGPVRFADYLTFFPVITVLAAIPITPGSLGVRENLFMAMFASVGTRPEVAVSLSLGVYATGLLWSLFGGLLMIASPGRREPASENGKGAQPQVGQQGMQ
jgi:uncharacterized protein (TIRG00374 family)